MDSFNAQNYHQTLNANWNTFPNPMFFAPPPGMPPPPLNFDPRTTPPPSFFFPPNYHHAIPHPFTNPYFQPNQNFNNGGNYFNNLNANNWIDAEKSVVKKSEDDGVVQSMKKWLESRKHLCADRDDDCGSKKPKCTISIPEFKNRLRTVMELEEKVKVMSGCVANGNEDCQCQLTVDHEVAIARAKEEMRTIQSSITDETVGEIKKKLSDRKRKRDRLKRKKERERKEEELMEERRRKVGEEIDKKLARVAEAEAAVKKEKEVSKAADDILFEVRRKISDVNKSLKTLTSVRKLREVRLSKKSGLISTDSTEVFEERVELASAFLKRQLQVYESEQRALQVMLNTENEADRERELERKKEKMRREVKREINEVIRQLFGVKAIPDQADPIYPFFHLYDLPSNDINSFLNVRHQWDQYLVPPGTPGATKIPRTWVAPSEPSSQSWSSWLSERPTT